MEEIANSWVGVTGGEAPEALPAPAIFAEVTVKVYSVRLVSPVTVQPVEGGCAVQLCPPGLAVAVYSVRAAPPSNDGAVHDTVACPLPRMPMTAVGGSGTVRGVTGEEFGEGKPVPAPLVAVTEKV